VNAKNSEGATLLHEAVSVVRSKEIVTLLIGAGADVNAKDENGNTPLHDAVGIEDREMVELLLAKEGINAEAQDEDGKTPLHIAVRQGCTEMVELLLKGGADVNVKDEWNMTALSTAVYRQRERMVELLLKAGADVNVKNNDNETVFRTAVLHIAADGGKELVDLLLDRGAVPDYGNVVNDVCSICYEPLGNGKEGGVVKLMCLHKFHKECIKKWMNSEQFKDDQFFPCPNCNQWNTSKAYVEAGGAAFETFEKDGSVWYRLSKQLIF